MNGMPPPERRAPAVGERAHQRIHHRVDAERDEERRAGPGSREAEHLVVVEEHEHVERDVLGAFGCEADCRRAARVASGTRPWPACGPCSTLDSAMDPSRTRRLPVRLARRAAARRDRAHRGPLARDARRAAHLRRRGRRHRREHRARPHRGGRRGARGARDGDLRGAALRDAEPRAARRAAPARAGCRPASRAASSRAAARRRSTPRSASRASTSSRAGEPVALEGDRPRALLPRHHALGRSRRRPREAARRARAAGCTSCRRRPPATRCAAGCAAAPGGCTLACADALEDAIRRAGRRRSPPSSPSRSAARPRARSRRRPGYWPRVAEICRRHGVLADRRRGDDAASAAPARKLRRRPLGRRARPAGGREGARRRLRADRAASSRARTVVAPIAARGDEVMFYTYGAHPAACAVADKVLEILEREALVERAARDGRGARASGSRALGAHPNVAEMRGLGPAPGRRARARPRDARALRARRTRFTATRRRGRPRARRVLLPGRLRARRAT